MTYFDPPIEVVTPFGDAVCTERVDSNGGPSFWICWIKETGIVFWFLNQEVRSTIDWSDRRYSVLPFKLDAARYRALDKLGQQHTYWRDNVARPPAAQTDEQEK